MQEFRIYLCLCLIFYLPHLKVAKKIKFTSFFLLTILTIKLIKYLFLAAWQYLNQQSVYSSISVCKYFSASFLVY